MKTGFQRIETKLVHAGEPEPRIEGAVAMPIFQSATFQYGGEATYDDLRYLRLSNCPNHVVLHKKLAALENAEAGLVTASGMAAISITLLSLLKSGDHLLAQNCLYGGTHGLITRDFPKLGLSYDFIDAENPSSWKASLRSNTRAIYVEAMTNPLLGVADFPAIIEFARSNNLVTVIDNTFASPINFRPLDLGFDLCIHSCTKYLNGHSDLVAGAVMGRAETIQMIRHRLNHLGAILDPHAAYLLHRGMKTLVLRVRYQNQSTLAIARFLQSHPAVERVNYPGLESHSAHGRASELFDGFGGVLSFEPRGGNMAAERFLKGITLPIVAPSLGSVETLAIRPAISSHAGLSKSDRERTGISDHLIRISVGIEATEDLIEDFDAALG